MILWGFLLMGCAASERSSSQQQGDAGQQAPGGGQERLNKKITAEEAKQMMDTEQTFVLLDVRSEREFKYQRIDGAILIPASQLKKRAASELPDKDALILVYCRSGARSATAANTLGEMGYTRVYDFGGIQSWPYETVSG